MRAFFTRARQPGDIKRCVNGQGTMLPGSSSRFTLRLKAGGIAMTDSLLLPYVSGTGMPEQQLNVSDAASQLPVHE
jgi:hypothetical protein